MKRKSLCAFCLVLWVLIVCSILTYRIEEWMTPWVDTVTYATDADTGEQYLPLDALVYEEERPVLYEVVEGTGWESGKQGKVVFEGDYVIFPDRIVLNVNYGRPYLHYASKAFRDLDAVNVTAEPMERTEDSWLLIRPPEALQTEQLSRVFVPEAQTSDALLLSVASAKQPFIPGRAKKEILFRQTDLPEHPQLGWEVYSLIEVRKLLTALPSLAVLLAGMIFSVGLWVLSCFLSKNARQNRAGLLSNLGICAALLVALPFFLKTIELPSSLLPKMNILDVTHYQTEFREIFANLTDLANAGSPTAAAVLESANQAKLLSIGIVLLGVVLLAAVIFAEILIVGKRSASKKKQVKK